MTAHRQELNYTAIGLLDYSHIYAGAERELDIMVGQLKAKGITCHVYVPFGMPHHKRYRFGADVIVPLSQKPSWWMGRWRWRKPPRGSDFAARLIFGVRLARALRRDKVDTLHVNLLRPDCAMWLLPSWLCGVRIAGHFRSAALDWVPPRLVRELCDRIVCISDFNRNRLLTRANAHNVVRIYDAVVRPEAAYASDAQTDHIDSEHRRTLWSVGQLTSYKGHDTAIRAFARLAADYPDLKLAVAGAGDDREKERLLRIVAEYPQLAGRVTIEGNQYSDMQSLYRSAEVVLSLSKTGEAFGLVPYEAALCGTAFVGIARGAVTEHVADGVNGMLATSSEPAEVESRLRFLLDNPDKSEEMSRSLAALVRSRLSPTRLGEGLVGLYQELKAENVLRSRAVTWSRRLRYAMLRRIMSMTPVLPLPDSCLVIAPHPDDEVLGMGGLLAAMTARGCNVTVHYLTDGEASHGGCCPAECKAVAEARRALSNKALGSLGLVCSQIVRHHLRDGQLESTDALADIIYTAIATAEVVPQTVFVTHPDEGWSDHTAAAEAALQAVGRYRQATGRCIRVYGYWVWKWHYNLNPQVTKCQHIKVNNAELRKKEDANKAYFSSVAPCGHPWSGRLPYVLHELARNDIEVFERLQS